MLLRLSSKKEIFCHRIRCIIYYVWVPNELPEQNDETLLIIYVWVPKIILRNFLIYLPTLLQLWVIFFLFIQELHLTACFPLYSRCSRVLQHIFKNGLEKKTIILQKVLTPKEPPKIVVLCTLEWDKICEVFDKSNYKLDSGSVSFTDYRTHFGIDVGKF